MEPAHFLRVGGEGVRQRRGRARARGQDVRTALRAGAIRRRRRREERRNARVVEEHQTPLRVREGARVRERRASCPLRGEEARFAFGDGASPRRRHGRGGVLARAPRRGLRASRPADQRETPELQRADRGVS